jgi:O-antigen/teichoic acid export membrane protein
MRSEKRELKEILKYSMSMLGINISRLTVQRSVVIILKIFVDLSTLAYYNIALKVSGMLRGLFTVSLYALDPLVSELHGAKDRAKLKNFFLATTKIMLCFIFSTIGIFIVLYKQFIFLWLGESFYQIIIPGRILLIYSSVAILLGIASNVLGYTGKHSYLSICSICNACLTVMLYFVLVKKYSLVGAALTPLVTGILIDALFVYRKALHCLNISFQELFNSVIFVFFGYFFIFILASLINRHVQFNNIFYLIFLMFLFSAICSVFFWFFSISKKERKLIVETIK